MHDRGDTEFWIEIHFEETKFYKSIGKVAFKTAGRIFSTESRSPAQKLCMHQKQKDLLFGPNKRRGVY